MYLFADAAQADTLWPDVVRAMAGNGFWLFLSVLFLLWTVEGVVNRYFRHRERMALIEAGSDPDGWNVLYNSYRDGSKSSPPADQPTTDVHEIG